MANKIATIGFLRQKVAGTPITISTTQGDTYCPTYAELLNGSIIPKIHIKIPRYSVGDGKGIYSSNQLVCEIDIDLILYGKLTVKNNYDGIVTAYTATQTATTQSVGKTAVFDNTFIIGEDVTVIVPCPVDEVPKYTYIGLTPKPDYLSWGSGDTSTQTISVSGIKNGSAYSTYTQGTGYTTMKDVTVITVYHNETPHEATTEITYPSISTGITSSYNFKMTLKSAATNTYNVVPPANALDVEQTAFLNFYSNDLNYFDASAEAVKETSGKTYDVTILSNSGGTASVSVNGSPTTYNFVGSGDNWSVVVHIPEGKNVIINRNQPIDSTSGGTDTYTGLFPTVTDLIYTETGETQTVSYNGIITTSEISAITWSVPSSAFTSLDSNKTVNLPLTSAVTVAVDEQTAITTPNVTLTQPTSNGFSANSNKNVVTVVSPRTKTDSDIHGSFVVTASNYSDATIYATLTSNEYYTLTFHSNSGGTVTVTSDGVAKTYELKGSGTDWSNEAQILKGSSVQIGRTIPVNETIGGETTVEGLAPSTTSLTYDTVSTQQKVTYTGTATTTATSSITWTAPSSSFTMNSNAYFDMPLNSTTKEIVASSSTITYPNVILNQTTSNGFAASASNNIVTITSPNSKKDIDTNGSFVVTANGGYKSATIDATLNANQYYTLTLTSNSGGTAYVGSEIYTFGGSGVNYSATGNVLVGTTVQVSRTIPQASTSGGTKSYEGLNPSSTVIAFDKESSSSTVTYTGIEKTTAISSITWSAPSSSITINGNKTFDMPLTSAVSITTAESTVQTTPNVTLNQASLNGFTASANKNTVTITSPSKKTDDNKEAQFVVSSPNYNQASIIATLDGIEYYTLTINSNSGGTAYVNVDGTQTAYPLVNGIATAQIASGKTATVTRTKPTNSSTTGETTYTGLIPASSTANFSQVSETKTFTYSGSKTTGTITTTNWDSESATVVMTGNKTVEVNLSSAVTTTQGTTTNVTSVSVSPSSSNGFTATASGLKVTVTAPSTKSDSTKTASFSVTQNLDSHINNASIDASLGGAVLTCVTIDSVASFSYTPSSISCSGTATPSTQSPTVTYKLWKDDGTSTTTTTKPDGITLSSTWGGDASSDGSITFTKSDPVGSKTGTYTATISGTLAKCGDTTKSSSKSVSKSSCDAELTCVTIDSVASFSYTPSSFSATGGTATPSTQSPTVTYKLWYDNGSSTTTTTKPDGIALDGGWTGTRSISDGTIDVPSGAITTSYIGTYTATISGTLACNPKTGSTSESVTRSSAQVTCVTIDSVASFSYNTSSISCSGTATPSTQSPTVTYKLWYDDGSTATTTTKPSGITLSSGWTGTDSSSDGSITFTESDPAGSKTGTYTATISGTLACNPKTDSTSKSVSKTECEKPDELDCTRSNLILSTTQLTIPSSASATITPTTSYTFSKDGESKTLYAYFHPYYTESGWHKWEQCDIED